MNATNARATAPECNPFGPWYAGREGCSSRGLYFEILPSDNYEFEARSCELDKIDIALLPELGEKLSESSCRS